MGELRSTSCSRSARHPAAVRVGGCSAKMDTPSRSASLMFDNACRTRARPSFEWTSNTDASFAKWEAQRNLEKLPRSAIPSAPGIGSTAVDRAVSRLESSPYARTAIERTGLSVKEFVLQTIALAQVAEAAQTGKSLSGATIPPENFLFVQRYTARVLYSRSRARTESRTYDWDADAADINSMQNEVDAQMQLDESERQGDAVAEQQSSAMLEASPSWRAESLQRSISRSTARLQPHPGARLRAGFGGYTAPMISTAVACPEFSSHSEEREAPKPES